MRTSDLAAFGITNQRESTVLWDRRSGIPVHHALVWQDTRVDALASTGASFCFIAGHEKPFDAARLKELYPTHATYVRAIRGNVAELVAGRFLTREDGAKLVKEAKAAPVP